MGDKVDVINNAAATVVATNEKLVELLKPKDSIALVKESNEMIDKIVEDRLKGRVKQLQEMLEKREELLQATNETEQFKRLAELTDNSERIIADQQKVTDKAIADATKEVEKAQKGFDKELDALKKTHEKAAKDFLASIEGRDETITELNDKAKEDFRAVVNLDFEDFIDHTIATSLKGWKYQEERRILRKADTVLMRVRHGVL